MLHVELFRIRLMFNILLDKCKITVKIWKRLERKNVFIQAMGEILGSNEIREPCTYVLIIALQNTRNRLHIILMILKGMINHCVQKTILNGA